MTRARSQRTLPEPRVSRDAAGVADLRRMVLLLETADVLAGRARRASDPAQIAVLLRRAEQRRREAALLRQGLAARGAVLAVPSAEQPPSRSPAFTQALRTGRERRK